MADSTLIPKKEFNNVVDYVYRHRDDSFVELPFNEVDNLVLSAFSYIPFEEFEKQNEEFKETTIQKMCVNYLGWIKIDEFVAKYPDWLRKSVMLAMALLKGKRFSKARVTHFANNFSEEDNTQFAAFNIILPDDSVAVVYRGTDNSMLGWKEDFHLACYDYVPSQKLASKFLKEMMSLYPESEFRVMGHSKGGNLALYAVSLLKKKEFERIVKVYSDDGPGVSEKVYYTNGNERARTKLVHIIVKSDIVGRLLSKNKTDDIIIDAEPKINIIKQHDLYNWKVDDCSFIRVDRVAPECEYFTDSVNEWLKNSPLPQEERVKLVDALFETQSKTSFENPGEIYEKPIAFALEFLRKLPTIKASDKKLIRKMFLSLASCFTKLYPKYLKDKTAVTLKLNKPVETKKEVKLLEGGDNNV